MAEFAQDLGGVHTVSSAVDIVYRGPTSLPTQMRRFSKSVRGLLMFLIVQFVHFGNHLTRNTMFFTERPWLVDRGHSCARPVGGVVCAQGVLNRGPCVCKQLAWCKDCYMDGNYFHDQGVGSKVYA